MLFVSYVCSDLAVGMKMYGKKSNDIWYKGGLVEIQNKENLRPEVCT